GPAGDPALVVGDVLYGVQGGELRAFDLKGARAAQETVDRKGATTKGPAWKPRLVALTAVPRLEVLTRAGSRLYAAAQGQVLAYDLPLRQVGARPSWQARVDGRPAHLVAGAGRLFVSTREGRLYCFGGDDLAPLAP